MKKKYKLLFIYMFIIGVYLILKDYYYGDILPNSFYYKSDVANRVSENSIQLGNFFLFYLSVPIILIIYSIAKGTFKAKSLFFLLIVGLVVNFYLRSRLDTNFSYRFFYHIYPVILVVSLFSIKQINKYFVYGLIVIQLALYGFDLPKHFERENQMARINNASFQMGNYIKDNYPQGTKLAVYFDAGQIPFISKFKTLDLCGLMSQDIGLREWQIRKEYKPIDEERKRNNLPPLAPGIIFEMKNKKLFEFDPDIIIVNALDSIPAKIENTQIGIFKTKDYDKFFRDQYLGYLQLDPRFRRNYKFVKSYGSGTGRKTGYYYTLYEKKIKGTIR